MNAPAPLPPPIIDIEASGFGRGSYPIEVGLVLPCGSSYCTLVSPLADWTHWSEDAQNVHGIHRDELLRYGRHAKDVAGLLNRLLADTTVYSDAWSHDLAWLGRLFEDTGIRQQFRLEALNTIIAEDQKPIWDATRALVTKDLDLRRQRASNDARILQLTWLRTRIPA